jgi:hypothetical protein
MTKEKNYTIVVNDDGHRFMIYNQPESTVRELGLIPASPTRVKQKAPVDNPEFATSKNVFGDFQTEQIAQIERKEAPKEEVIITSRDRMGNLVGVR